MKIIYKYRLNLTNQQQIQLPEAAHILDIQKQDEGYQLWALVDTDNPLRDYHVTMVGTGDPIPDFVDLTGNLFNCTTQDGWAVWHWFVKAGPLA